MDTKQSDAHTFQGGPAFPSVEMQDAVRIFPGMTLRDAFAAAALTELGNPDSKWTPTKDEISAGITWADKLAKGCYEVANAMLAERLK